MTQQQFTTPNPVQLEVKVATGDIRITSVDGDQSTAALEGSPKLIEAMNVELIGDRLRIEQRQKSPFGWFGRWQESVRVDVRVPHGSIVEIATAAADATLDGDFAAAQVKSASGNVVARGNVARSVRLKTVSGDARLAHVGGDLTAHTVSGDIEAESVDGSVFVKSVSGDVRVNSLREGQADVRSVSGDVELGIASGTSVDVDAGSASGELSSEVALSPTPGGGGGPTVVIRSNTVSGNFRVFRAA